MKTVAVAAIRLYQQVLSPYLPGMCRYHPTCSQYALDAISRYGVVRGTWLGMRRIFRCTPVGGHGYDPVV